MRVHGALKTVFPSHFHAMGSQVVNVADAAIKLIYPAWIDVQTQNLEADTAIA